MTEDKKLTSLPPPPLGRERIGRYEVVYPLAQGGMGSVHVGRLSGMGGFSRLVAIKAIHLHLVTNQQFIDMFLDEARLAANIHHPNVAETFDVGQDEGLLYMVSELILGQNLRHVYRRAANQGLVIPPALTANIIAQVCRGLHSAHELRNMDGQLVNLVHRDISPHNVMVSNEGFVKLIDFGVAFAKQGRNARTTTGTLKGKLSYMAPETFNGEVLDRRADIFAMGVTLYVLLTGQHPFRGISEIETIRAICDGNTTPLKSHRPELEAALVAIVNKAMATDKNRRFDTADEMADALEHYVNHVAAATNVSLRQLMTHLFANEIQEHRERIREFTESSQVTNVDQAQPAHAASAEALPPAELQNATVIKGRRKNAPVPPPIDPALPTGSGTPDPAAPDPAAPSAAAIHKRWILGVTLAVLVGAVVVMGIALLKTDPISSPSSAPEPFVAPQPSQMEPTAHPGAKGETMDFSDVEEEDAPALATVKLTLSPSTANATLDGKPISAGTHELPINEDDHKLIVEAPGYETETRSVRLTDDTTWDVTLKEATSIIPQNRKSPTKTKPARKSKVNLLDDPYN